MMFPSLRSVLRRKALRRSSHSRPALRASSMPRLEALEDRLCLSTITVLNTNDSGAGSLRAAVSAAQNGDTINFAPYLRNQTIALTSGELDISKNLTITGLGANKLTVSGSGSSRVFAVSSGVTASINNLTIANGLADQGGGVSNSGALTLSHDVLTNNKALGDTATTGLGGGIFNDAGASLSIDHSTLLTNQVAGGTGIGLGGGLYNLGTVTIDRSVFNSNLALGGLGAPALGAGGQGGAIDNMNGGTVTISNSTFTNNQAQQGQASYGIGGAIDSENNTSLTVSDSSFIDNTATGSIFASGGAVFSYTGSMAFTSCRFAGNLISSAGFCDGGGLEDQAGPATLTNCVFTQNTEIGTNGASTGAAAVSNVLQGAVMTMTNCTLIGNVSQAGDGADGVNSFGQANGGAILNELQSVLTLTNCTIANNVAHGGNQSNNSGAPTPDSAYVGLALGAAVFNFNGSSLTISGSTISGNQTIAGNSSVGPGALAAGGAIDSDTNTTLQVVHTSFLGNRAVGGAGAAGSQGGTALGGAVVVQFNSTATIDESLFVNNAAVGGAGGSGGAGGIALGGALALGHGVGSFIATDNSALTISNSLVTNNTARGGTGGVGANGGEAVGGGVFAGLLDNNGPSNSVLTATNTLSTLDKAVGGAGGAGANGGNGLGGGFYASAGATACFQQCAIAFNSALGGKRGHGGTDGEGIGGGVYVETDATVGATSTAIFANFASTSNNDIYGVVNPTC